MFDVLVPPLIWRTPARETHILNERVGLKRRQYRDGTQTTRLGETSEGVGNADPQGIKENQRGRGELRRYKGWQER